MSKPRLPAKIKQSILLIRIWLKKLFSKQLLFVYLIWYPLEDEIQYELKRRFKGEKGNIWYYYPESALEKKIYAINKLRIKNIIAALWSNQGTLIAFIFTLTSLVIATIAIAVKSESLYGITIIVLVYLVLLWICPLFLRKFIEFSAPKAYASISLNVLNQSEILSFVAYKYWILCNRFLKKHETQSKVLLDIHTENAEEMIKFKESIIKFISDNYLLLSQCKALKHEATNILNILPIEFSHHITKFSPYIMENKINSINYSLDTILHLLPTDDQDDNRNSDERKIRYSKIKSIFDDISNRREHLFQLIAYDNIHKYLIGLSAVSSTSRSLKIFTNGLFHLIENGSSQSHLKESYKFDPFISLVRRSKSHYGLDLFIAMDNFLRCYTVNNSEEITELLNKFKTVSITKKKTKESKNNFNKRDVELFLEFRTEFLNQHSHAITSISNNFEKRFSNDIKERNANGTTYLFIVGHSRVVVNVLKKLSDFLDSNRIKIFVMKSGQTHMLDTRITRYELALSEEKFRYTFTGSDELFFNFLTSDDSLHIIMGAEAYETKRKLLFQTNTYYHRLNIFLKKIKRFKRKKPTPKFWILTEKYKVHESLNTENGNSKIKQELYADHYDTLEVYNFIDLRFIPNLITD